MLLHRADLHWNTLVVARTSFASSGSLAPALVGKLTAAVVQPGLVVLPVELDRPAQREVALLDLGRWWAGHTVGCLEALSVSKVFGGDLVVAVGMPQQGVLAATGRSAVLVAGIGLPVATRQLLGPGGY